MLQREEGARGGQRSPACGMALEQSSNGVHRVTMKTSAGLAPGLAARQPPPLGEILCVGHGAHLGQQIGLALRGKKDLERTERAERAGGGPPADPALVLAQAAKEVLQTQIVGGESRDIVAEEQLGAPGPPETPPRRQEGRVGWPVAQQGRAGGQQRVHLGPHLGTAARGQGREGLWGSGDRRGVA